MISPITEKGQQQEEGTSSSFPGDVETRGQVFKGMQTVHEGGEGGDETRLDRERKTEEEEEVDRDTILGNHGKVRHN